MGHDYKYERCIRNFVAKDTLVLVTAIVDGFKGDGQVVNMHVCFFSVVLSREHCPLSQLHGIWLTEWFELIDQRRSWE